MICLPFIRLWQRFRPGKRRDWSVRPAIPPLAAPGSQSLARPAFDSIRDRTHLRRAHLGFGHSTVHWNEVAIRKAPGGSPDGPPVGWPCLPEASVAEPCRSHVGAANMPFLEVQPTPFIQIASGKASQALIHPAPHHSAARGLEMCKCPGAEMGSPISDMETRQLGRTPLFIPARPGNCRSRHRMRATRFSGRSASEQIHSWKAR